MEFRTGRSQGDQRSRFSSTSFDRVAFGELNLLIKYTQ
jgi:hypothetical protein